jgi:hypothetical protein
MRNEVHDNENVHDSVVARRTRRRKQAIIGAAGLAVLGAGTFLVAYQGSDDSGSVAQDAAVSAPVTAASVTPSATVPASAAAPSVAASPSVKPSASATPLTDKQRIKAARSAAARASGQVRRPLTPVNGGATVAAADISMSVSGSAKKEGELRLYSARADLTGQKELAWVTDEYETVGNVNCTQKIRLSANVEPRVRPTLLICWRTSAAKSVYTVAVKMEGRPSRAMSVAAINKQWARLD